MAMLKHRYHGRIKMSDVSFGTNQDTNVWPFGLSVARGIVPNMSGIQKFGYNASVGHTAFETVWDGGGTYPYVDNAGTVAVTSDETGDDNGGIVEVQGLDANYNLQTVTVEIGGSASTETFVRIFRMRLKTMPEGDSAGDALPQNQGTLSATVDGRVIAQIQPEIGQTLMSVYTVPAGYRAYLVSFDVGNSKDQEVEAKVMKKDFANGVFNTVAYSTLRGTPFRKEYKIFEVFDEKTDIEVRAKSNTTASVSAGFELLLEKK